MDKLQPTFRVAEILKEKGLPSKFLCEALDKPKQYISAIVNNRQNVSFHVMAQIADALDVPIWQLFASPSEVQPNNGLHAVIDYRGVLYKATTLSELEEIVEKLKAKS